jgi:hypothetical protein
MIESPLICPQGIQYPSNDDTTDVLEPIFGHTYPKGDTQMGNPLYYAAAATTAIAGILHLVLDLAHIGSNILGDTFFIVA